MATLDDISWTRLVWNTNRLRKGTRRAKRNVSPGTRANSPVQSNRDRSPS